RGRVAGKSLEGVADALQSPFHGSPGAQLRGILRGQTQGIGLAPPASAIQNEQRRQVGASFTQHHRLIEERVTQERCFHVGWSNLLARGGHDDVLEAPSDADAAIMDSSLVTRVQPSIPVERGCGLGRALPIPQHDTVAVSLELLLRANSHQNPGQRAAHRLWIVVLRNVAGNHRGALGHSISLQDRYSERKEGARNLESHGRTTSHRRTQTPTEARAQHLPDLSIEQRKNQPIGEAELCRSSLLVTEAAPAHLYGGLQDMGSEPAPADRLAQGGVCAFVNARHRYENRGPYGEQIFREQSDGACICNGCARGHGKVVADGALARM